MSLLPLLFSDWWEELDRPHRLLDQNFGTELRPDQLQIASRDWFPRLGCRRHAMNYYRPWAEIMRRGEGGTSTVKPDKNEFQVILDVQQFSPEEINVKVVDKYVVVEGKHEEKKDEHGWISRQFSRKYMIPEQCDLENVASSLSSDGVLTIVAPRKNLPRNEEERMIEVERTGKPAQIKEHARNGEPETEKKKE